MQTYIGVTPLEVSGYTIIGRFVTLFAPTSVTSWVFVSRFAVSPAQFSLQDLHP